MAAKILAILEQRDGLLKRSAFETVQQASQLAKDLSLEAEAVVVGGDVENINEISNYGIAKIVHLKNSDLSNYSSSGYTSAVSDYAKETDADYLIFSNTALGKDLAPRVSIRLSAGCIIDCIKLDSSSGELVATRPVYAGKALVDVKLNSAKKVITIRPNVFKAVPLDTPLNPEIEVKEISSPDLRTKVIEVKTWKLNISGKGKYLLEIPTTSEN